MSKYLFSKSVKVEFTAMDIAHIIKDESYNLLGGYNRHVEDGEIWRRQGYLEQPVRKITDEELELHNALLLVSKHFKNMKEED